MLAPSAARARSLIPTRPRRASTKASPRPASTRFMPLPSEAACLPWVDALEEGPLVSAPPRPPDERTTRRTLVPDAPKLAFACRPEKDGNVSLFIVKDGKLDEGLGMPASMVGTIVAPLLAVAKVASEQAGLAPFAMGTSLEGVPAIQVSGTGLAQGPQPGTLVLIVHAGQARLGIQLDKKRARSLGEALVAASAPEERSQ